MQYKNEKVHQCDDNDEDCHEADSINDVSNLGTKVRIFGKKWATSKFDYLLTLFCHPRRVEDNTDLGGT